MGRLDVVRDVDLAVLLQEADEGERNLVVRFKAKPLACVLDNSGGKVCTEVLAEANPRAGREGLRRNRSRSAAA